MFRCGVTMPVFPTLLVSRRPRQVGVDWTGARSWLGGAPRIGSTSWPRDKNGEPLHFVAQIDLAEVATVSGKTLLPDKGSLAFFIGRDGAVVFVPEDRATTPALPPADTPDLTTYGGSDDWRTDLSGRPLFPYWPLDFTALDLPPSPEAPTDDDDDYDDYDDRCQAFRAAQVAAVERHFKRREYNLSPGLAFAGPPIPDWWQTALHFADHLDKRIRRAPEVLQKEQHMIDWAHKRAKEAGQNGEAELKKAEASVAMYEARLAKARELQPVFADFVTEVTSWAAGRDPWVLMAPEDMTRLAAYWTRNPQFGDFTESWGVTSVDYLKDRMFKALPAAGDPSFATLPAAVRQLINAKRAPRPMWWHSALHFVSKLDEAAKLRVPLVSKTKREYLEADRNKLRLLHPKGVLASLGRMIGGSDKEKAKELADVEARVASTEAALAELSRLEPVFRDFVQETSDWCGGRDPWSFMTPADIEQLKARLKRAEEQFRECSGVYALTMIEYLEAATLRTLATADSRGYATLPEQVRALINQEYLLPPGRWHQMFGWGEEIQGDSSAMREEGYIMLLQLTHDDMMFWGFGDNGVYQFWISPDDLARRNWSAVRMTCECH
jgi:hypothetical protein